jgi:Flp pilus assembly protein TadG
MKRRRHERGAAAVEFALVMPILLLIVFGIIDFGYLYGQKLALNNAARQSARYAAVENRTCNDVTQQAVDASAPTITLPASNVTIKRTSLATPCGTPTTDLPCKGSADQDNVSVTLTYDAPVLVPVVPGLGTHKVLAATGVFRCEFS